MLTYDNIPSVHVEGTLRRVLEEVFCGKNNGGYKKTGKPITERKDCYQGIHGGLAYGNMVEDESGVRSFFQDNVFLH